MTRTTGGLLSALVIIMSAGYVYVSKDAPVVAMLATTETAAEGSDPLGYASTGEATGLAAWYQIEREEDGVSLGVVDSLAAVDSDSLLSILTEWGYGVTVRIRLRGYYWGLIDGSPHRLAGPWSDWSDPLIDSGPPPGEIQAPDLTARAVDPKVLQ